MKKLSIILAILCFVSFAFAQTLSNETETSKTPYKIGERLTYSISFSKFNEAAYAETHVVSSGKLNGKDVIELRSKLKTTNFVNAAFFSIDDSRTTFISPTTGIPLRTVKSIEEFNKIEEKPYDFPEGATFFDLLSAIFQIRTKSLNQGNVETFQIQEGEESYSVQIQVVGKEKVKTSAGEFETILANVTGVQQFQKLQINFSDDERHLPVLFRFGLPKGKVRAELAGVQNLLPIIKEPIVFKPPTGKLPPIQNNPPKAKPYKDNEPLANDLPFALGEKLRFKVSWQALPAGIISLQAKERKQFFDKKDLLLLRASVEELSDNRGILNKEDFIESYVDPFSLLPYTSEIKLNTQLNRFNQKLKFDQSLGTVTDNQGTKTEIPIGTHDLLSFVYAMRGFGLRMNLNPSSPAVDTKSSVFIGKNNTVFTIKPIANEVIEINSVKVLAQKLAVSLNSQDIEQPQIQLWVSNDRRRLPVRIIITGSFGVIQADLMIAK